MSVAGGLRTKRFNAICDIAAVQEGDESVRFARMLEIATKALRPKLPTSGTLSHLDGDDLVIEAISWTGNHSPNPLREFIGAGSRIPLHSSVARLLASGSATRAWDDFTRENLGDTLAGKLGLGAVLGTRLQIGRRTYFLVFSSPETTGNNRFTDLDIAYIELLAAFFSHSFTQRDHVERLKHWMSHDALTGLPNRVALRTALRQWIADGASFLLVTVNLDHFRIFNQLHGHMLADEVLVEIAASLANRTPGDFVARTNGDEFGILLQVGDDALGAIQHYVAIFRSPFNTGDRDGSLKLSVSASFAAVGFPSDGQSAEELLRRVEVAMAIAKSRGGDTVVRFEPPMQGMVDSRRTGARDIANASISDKFRLAYQPTFDLHTNQVVGAEALIRWDHPSRGELLPAEFIPFAEQNGVVGTITQWVIKRLTRDLAAADLPSGFRCFFNLSAYDLRDVAVIAALGGALEEHPVLADRLGVEITESAAMTNVEHSLSTLAFIRDLGCLVAIDDFGTGYSSLSYLKQLTVDLLKIDQSFIAGLPYDERDSALVESMIGISKRFNLRAVGEGIETEGQRAWLADNGCRYGQGFLLARPLSFEALLALLPGCPELSDAHDN